MQWPTAGCETRSSLSSFDFPSVYSQLNVTNFTINQRIDSTYQPHNPCSIGSKDASISGAPRSERISNR